MKQIIKILICFSIFLWGVCFFEPMEGFSGQMPSSDVDVLLKKVEKEFEHVNSIKLYFYQAILRKGQTEPIRGKGTAWFMRPDKMRWEYEQPEKEVIVVDSENVFIWEPEANQVMVYKKRRFVPGSLGDIFFPKVEGLKRDFDIKLIEDSGDNVIIECRPRHEFANVKKIMVTFSKKGHMYSKIGFEDNLGTQTEIKFKGIEINPKLNESLFEFQVPDGAKVYYQE